MQLIKSSAWQRFLVPSTPTGEPFKHFGNSSAEDSSALRKLAPIYLQTPHAVKVQRHTARLPLISFLHQAVPQLCLGLLAQGTTVHAFSPACFAKLDENKAKPGGTPLKGGKDSSTSPKTHTHRRRSALNLGSQVRVLTSLAAPLLNICHSQV